MVYKNLKVRFSIVVLLLLNVFTIFAKPGPAVAPTVVNVTIISSGTTTATAGGNVTSQGSSSVTARGVCWNTSANPTTANSKTTDGTGTGTYSSSITGLVSGTTYHVRAYATNTTGTSYGPDITYTHPYCAQYTALSHGMYVVGMNFAADTKITGGVNHFPLSSTTPNIVDVSSSSGTFPMYHGRDIWCSPYSGTASMNYYFKMLGDWNHDGDFSDSGEDVYERTNTVAVNTSDNFAQTLRVPLTATPGTTRIRYILNEGSSPTACGNVSGQVIDYIINVTTNSAPVLNNTGSPALTTIKDTDTDPSGLSIDAFIATTSPSVTMITDANDETGSTTPRGIAIYGKTGSNGTWQYKVGTGSWTNIGAVTSSNALLLLGNGVSPYNTDTKIRFLPSGGAEVPTISFYAWDGTSGSNATYASIGSTGGTNAFSTATETGSVTVLENSAPVIDNSSIPVINSLKDTQTNSDGFTIDELTNSTLPDVTLITDADDAIGLISKGIAIYNQTATNGTWQYKVGTGAWTDFGAVSGTNALHLMGDISATTPTNSKIRFVPTGPGNASFDFYAWDAAYSVANAAYASVASRGGRTAYSTASENAPIAVTSASDYLGSKIYIATDASKIITSDILRSTPSIIQSESLISGNTTYSSNEIEIDFTHDKMYWGDFSTGKSINYSDIKGNNIQTISPSGSTYISGLAFNASNLFYLDWGLGLMKANLDGTNPVAISGGSGQLNKSDIGWPYDLECYNNKLYFSIYSNANSDYRLYKSDTDGSNVTLLTNSANQINGIYVTNNIVYYTETDFTDSYVKSISTSGGSITSLVTNLASTNYDLVVDSVYNTIYFTSVSTSTYYSSLNKVSTTGGSSTKIETFGTTTPYSLVLDLTPSVTTITASSVGSTSASSGGNVTSSGGTSITARGVCWSTSSNPTIASSKTTDATGTGSFTSSITGLSASTTYHYRAYATNASGTSYGSDLTFTTTSASASAPTVTTTTASSVASTTISSGGNVTSDGGASVTAYGVCWSTSENPTITDNITTDGTGTESFTSSIIALLPNTTYHYRAYATNSVGTSYGSDLTFTTTSLPTATEDWNQVLKVVASDRSAGDNYGYNVAISGSYAVVGAPLHDLDVSGANSLSNAGAAYILKQTNGVWSQVQKIVSSDRAASDNFGYRVAIDGNYIVVGAWAEDEDALGSNTLNNAGSAYIFKNNSGTWSQIKKIVSSDRVAADNFGIAVTISGNYIAVGAHLQDFDASNSNSVTSAGAVYLYLNNSDTWSQVQKIVPSDRSWQDYFGISLSINGDYLAVGARQEGTEPFMSSSAAPYLAANNIDKNTCQGAVYMYKNVSGTWTSLQKLAAPVRNASDLFGWSVSLNSTSLLVGSPNEDEDASELNSITDAGASYLFENFSDSWKYTQKIVASDRATSDLFGRDVAINGTHLVVGAFQEDEDASGSNTLADAGSAYVFEKVSGAWIQTKKIVSSDRAASDNFGYRVALDGSNGLITAYQEDEDVSGGNTFSAAGSIYAFSLIPQVASVTVPNNGNFTTAQNLDFTVNFTHSITVTGTPRISLTLGSTVVYANYLSGTGTSALIFRYAVQNADQDLDGISVGTLSLNSGTLSNNSNNALTTLNNVGSTSLITVNVVVSSPTVSTVGTLSAFSSCSGTVSTSQSFTVSGTNLTNDIVVTPPTGYEVSILSGSGYGSSVILTQASGTVSSTTIYIRLTSFASGTPSGNIVCSSTGATSQNVAVSGTVNALPTITLGSNPSVCNGTTSANLTYSATTSSPNQYSIAWSSLAIIAGFTNVSNNSLPASPISLTAPSNPRAGSYTGTLTVTNSTTGCSSTVSTMGITVNALPTITLGSNPSICNGTTSANLTYSATTSSPNQYSIAWSAGAIIAGFSNVSTTSLPASPISITAPSNPGAGSYTGTLTVTNSTTGCSRTGSPMGVTVNALPTITLGSNPSVSNGTTSASLTYSATTSSPNQYSIAWSAGAIIGGFTNVSLTSLPAPPISLTVPSNPGAGSYTGTLTVKNTTTGCSSTGSTMGVTVTSSFSASIGSQTNVSCFGGSNGSATITPSGGTAPYTYSWSPSGGSSATATGLTAGSYTVTVNDAVSHSTTVSVTITQSTALASSVSSQTNISCNAGSNGSATILASGGTPSYSYSWSPSGGTAATATGLSAGAYTVTITDANSCTKTQSVTITQPSALIAGTSQNNVTTIGGSDGSATVTPSGGTTSYSYSWSPSGGTGATASELSAGTFICTITDANSCTLTKTFTITQPTNHAPTASNSSVNAGQNADYVYTASNFSYVDSDSDVLNRIQITTLPVLGTLYNDDNLNGVVDVSETLLLNGTVTKTIIDARKLKFKPVTNALGTVYTTFGYKVHDGIEYSTLAYTMSINVLYPTSTVTGSWSTSGTWNISSVPTSTQNAEIATGHTVTISGNTTINDLKLDNGANITVTGTAILTINGDLYDALGTFTIAPGAKVLLKGNIRNNQGTIKVVNTSTNGMEIKGNVDVPQGSDG